MSSEEDKKGTLQAGKLADLVILSGDYFSMPADEVKNLESLLTMVGGKVVYGAGPYSSMDAPALPALPDWLPLKQYGGYYKQAGIPAAVAAAPIAHRHPLIIGDGGSWSMECPCAG